VERLEQLLPQAEVVHLAAHGISSPAAEGLLLFASGGEEHSARGGEKTVLWDASHIRSMLFRNAKLVVLSACSSGKNSRSRSEIHGGLVRALFAAEVPNVVASRWDIDSAVTRQFMDSFYSELVSSGSVALAVAYAESQMREKRHMEHPHYWAGFAAMGRG
jgi:CHAT domain-containing protein